MSDSAKVELAKLTGPDLSNDEENTGYDLSMPGYKQVLAAPPVSTGSPAPVLSDDVQALLIMNGCCAQWVINYWRITRRVEPGQLPIGMRLRPGQKYRVTTGASAEAPFSEWQSVLKSFVGEATGVEN